MRIVFEGADLAGKSTLAKEVAKALKLPYRGKITRVAADKLMMTQQQDFKTHPHAVLDRCYWMSNLIYEPLTVHAPSIISTGPVLQGYLQDDETVYVLITANEATLGARYNERGDELQTLSTIIEASRMYLRFVQARPPKHFILFSTDKGSIADNVAELVKLIKTHMADVEEVEGGNVDAAN